jgi:transposase
MHLVLTPDDRRTLEQLLRQTTLSQAIAKRVRVVLALADGDPYATIAARAGCTDRFIAIWKRRFLEGGVLAMADAPRAGRGHGMSAALEAKIVRLTLQTKPPAPLTHWSSRRLAAKLGVAHTTVTKVWKLHGLKPHRLERYKGSSDPEFETKAADIIGLYIAPPTNAVVFCVDEKTAIQELNRTDPVLPLRPGRAETHGFEYVRHGTRSLYAALDVGTGRVQGKVAVRHTSAEFVDFLDTVTRAAPRGKAVHLVVDNLSAHKTQAVKDWLAAHPRVTMHDTPTYSSWLNWHLRVVAGARYRAFDRGVSPRRAAAVRAAGAVRRGPGRGPADVAAFRVPRAHRGVGVGGRSRVRDPPRARRRPQSRRPGAAHLRPRRQGRDLLLR